MKKKRWLRNIARVTASALTGEIAAYQIRKAGGPKWAEKMTYLIVFAIDRAAMRNQEYLEAERERAAK